MHSVPIPVFPRTGSVHRCSASPLLLRLMAGIMLRCWIVLVGDCVHEVCGSLASAATYQMLTVRQGAFFEATQLAFNLHAPLELPQPVLGGRIAQTSTHSRALVPLMKTQSSGACPEHAKYLHRRPMHPIDRFAELRSPLHGESSVLDAPRAHKSSFGIPLGLLACPAIKRRGESTDHKTVCCFAPPLLLLVVK